MAGYKVIQNIEAEDKLLGPLTLRQFIYGVVAAVCLYLGYFLASHGASFMLALFLPMAAIAGFFAFPWGRDQPTEIWALAKIRFMLKPRRRVWNQSGVKELVTITAPKKVAINYTNGLSQEEVKNRLQALASTIDTRGWAIKNANINFNFQPATVTMSDRLLAPTSLPKPVEETDVKAADDILDERNNVGAQRLQTMIDQSAKEHRDRLIKSLQQDTPPQPAAPKPADYWFLNQPSPSASIPSDMVTFNTQVVTPGATPTPSSTMPSAPTPDEAHIVAELKEHERLSPTSAYYGHMHTIQPLSQQSQPPAQPPMQPVPAPPVAGPAPVSAAPVQPPPAPVTPASQAAILQLASNDDLNVATLAREAERSTPQDEVVIKLH